MSKSVASPSPSPSPLLLLLLQVERGEGRGKRGEGRGEKISGEDERVSCYSCCRHIAVPVCPRVCCVLFSIPPYSTFHLIKLQFSGGGGRGGWKNWIKCCCSTLTRLTLSLCVSSPVSLMISQHLLFTEIMNTKWTRRINIAHSSHVLIN